MLYFTSEWKICFDWTFQHYIALDTITINSSNFLLYFVLHSHVYLLESRIKSNFRLEVWNALHSTSIQLCYPGCQERVPPGDDSYQASSSIQPPRLARLNSSNPGASVVAWCRGLDNENGYVQIDLGRSCYFVKMKIWKHITLNCMEIWLMPRPKWWDQLTRLWYSCRYRMTIGDLSHSAVSFATLNNEISSHEH